VGKTKNSNLWSCSLGHAPAGDEHSGKRDETVAFLLLGTTQWQIQNRMIETTSRPRKTAHQQPSSSCAEMRSGIGPFFLIESMAEADMSNAVAAQRIQGHRRGTREPGLGRSRQNAEKMNDGW
jgi:hypothetical protein